MSKSLVVTVSIITEDDTEATRAAEVLSRAMIGLALEGLSAGLNIASVDVDEEP